MHTGLRRPLSLATPARSPRRGFTLLEALIAVTLTLMLMGMVVTAFGMITTSVNTSRATIGINDKLRAVKHTLISDLSGVTVTMLPPRNPENGEGYFVYKEGDVFPASVPFKDEDNNGVADNWTGPTGIPDAVTDNWDRDPTAGDHDDVIIFTTRKTRDTFAGFDGNGNVIESPVAEVAYFVRGTTLYRRTLLVAPQAVMPAAVNDYGLCDISSHMRGGNTATATVSLDRTDLASSPTAPYMVANTLSDLTKPQNRFGHQPYAYPHSVDFWGYLGLPTLRETSHADWPIPVAHARGAVQYVSGGGDTYDRLMIPYGANATTVIPRTSRIFDPVSPPTPAAIFDPWRTPLPWNETKPDTSNIPLGTLTAYDDGARRGTEDVLMTNVLAFDVKAYDPGAPHVSVNNPGPDMITGNSDDLVVTQMPGDSTYPATPAAADTVGYGAYVDLGYSPNYAVTSPTSSFHGNGGLEVGTGSPRPRFGQRIYDTWSTHFESDGVDNDQFTVSGDTSAIDLKTRNPSGVAECPPPYPAPLRGIQIRIRAFEPDSRQIRQVTIVHDFLPQ